MTYDEMKAMMAENIKGFAELRESQRKTDEQIERVGERIDKLNATVTGISNNIGFHAEEYFQEALTKNKTFGGEKYDKIIKNLSFCGKENCEFDIFLVNGQSVAIIEAKNRIHPSAVEDVAVKKVAQFRKYFPEYKDYKLCLGIAGFSFDKYVVEEAQKYGVGIIRQVGDAIEISDENLKVY